MKLGPMEYFWQPLSSFMQRAVVMCSSVISSLRKNQSISKSYDEFLINVSSPDPPSHVHHLILKAVFFSTVLLDLGVDILHQGVPLHQHVREGRAREDPDNLSKL